MRSLWQKIEEGPRLSPKEGLHKKVGYRREKSAQQPDDSQKKNESSVGNGRMEGKERDSCLRERKKPVHKGSRGFK